MKRVHLACAGIVASVLTGCGGSGGGGGGDPPRTFVHLGTAANTTGAATIIDHPLLNDDSDALFLVTYNFSPEGVGTETYHDRAVALYFDTFHQKWGIRREDLSTMPVGTAWNVHIPEPGPNAFVHVALTTNVTLDLTEIDHPALNENPGARFFVTQRHNLGFGVHNESPVGLYYDTLSLRWGIYNEDGAAMPIGTTFNVWIPPIDQTFAHQSNAGNVSGNFTNVDDAGLNGSADAAVQVVHVYNAAAGLAFGDSHPHHVGVWFPSPPWAIYNQDLVPFAEGRSFFVWRP